VHHPAPTRPSEPHWSSIVSFIDALTQAGYAVAIFCPEELGKVSAEKVASHMIEHGWQLIDTENAPPVEDRIDLFDPTTDTTEFIPPRSLDRIAEVTPEEEEAWRNWKERGANK